MNKKQIKEVVVVEGKNDTNHLREYFDVETIETNGLGISKETIELIRRINKKKGVILLLDPDTPGEKIRKKINDSIPNLKNIFLYKKEARTSKKVGVEHASKETLMKAFDNVVTYCCRKNEVTYSDYVKLGYVGKKDSSLKRDALSQKYRLGKCNAKTLFKRINMLGLKLKEIENE